jgi:peptide/nickel transport system permease protein
MRNYALKRVLMLGPLLLGVSLMTFVMLRIVPGDAAVARAGLSATPERVEELRHELGLDRPYFPISIDSERPFVHVHSDSQFGDWLAGVMRGDLGESTTFNAPVSDEIIERIPVTLELMLLSGLLTVFVGVPAGIVSGIRQNTPVDLAVRWISIFCMSIPTLWLGILLLLFPVIWWGWAPPVAYVPIWEDPVENLQLMLLPAITLAAASSAIVMRLTRSAMLDVLRNDFVRTARAKGLGERQVVMRHAIKNAMIPVVTFVGIQLVTLISGAVVVEQVFSINGLGRLLFTSVFSRDYAMVQGLVLFIAVAVLLMNLAVDLVYGWLDPRIRYT